MIFAVRMNIYSRQTRWKFGLGAAGFIIVLVTMLYSQYLARSLAERELNIIELYAEAVKSLNRDQSNMEDNTVVESLIIERLGNIPIITESEEGILVGYNYRGEDETTDQEYLAKVVERILKSGYEPIEGSGYATKIYYENSRLYKLISWFPIAQILLLGTFVLFGYFFVSSSRRAEQNRVWAGMAKETAHQLGTPVSAILGWIEHLRELSANNTDQLEVIDELSNDVMRLELIADRFSKIGSKPELKVVDIIDELDKCRNYMQKRAPRKIRFDFPDKEISLPARINPHLFDWVIENLIRNSLDAMDNQGTITANVYASDSDLHIEISDTGKGIPASDFKNVFKPGFTTKQRGWGLGLSLAKRIIENYHNGKLYVKESRINEGTTFSIRLPRI